MKKALSIFSLFSLLLGLVCFLFVLFIGFEPIFGGRGFFWRDFFSLIFQPIPVIIIPTILCLLVVLANIILLTKFFHKQKSESIEANLKSVLKLSMGIILILSAVILLSVLKECAHRTSCVGNMKQIGLALRMYSNANNEQFPHLDGVDGLELLRKSGMLENPVIYVCHSSGTKPGKFGEPLTADTVDYMYRGGYNERDSVDISILYDKKHNHYNFGNILFIDGHVGRFFGNNWQKNINPKMTKGDFVFLGTIEKLDSSSFPQSRLNWVVQCRIDEIKSGEFSGKTFSFRVHSPAKSGLEVGKQYTIKAVWTQNGYTVDQYQWNP